MLWGVRQAFRHIQRATCVHPGRVTPAQLFFLFTLARAQWASLAVAYRPIHHAPHPPLPAPLPAISEDADQARQPPRVQATLGAGKGVLKQAKEKLRHEMSSYVRALDKLYARLVRQELGGPEYQSTKYRSLLALLRSRTEATNLAVSMVHTSHPHRAQQALLLAHHLGCKCNHALYENVARELAMARKWDLVVAVVVLGLQHVGRPSVRLLNWHLRALMELGRFADLEGVAAGLNNANLTPNRLTFHLLISAHLRNRNLTKAKEYMEKMEGAGIPVDASTYGLVASVDPSLGSDPDVRNRALASLAHLDGRSGTAILNSLLRMSLDKADERSVVQYSSFLEDSTKGLERSYLDGVDSIRRDDEPLDRVAVQAPFVSPDIATFTMLVESLGRQHQQSHIPAVVARMKSLGVQPDETFLETLVRAYVLGGDTATAVNLVYDACPFSPLVHPYFLQLGLDVSGEGRFGIQPLQVTPNGRVLNALLQGLLDTYGVDSMGTILQIMDVLRISPDESFAETVLSFMASAAAMRPWQLILALKKLSKAIPVSTRVLHLVMKSIVRQESLGVRKGKWFAAKRRHLFRSRVVTDGSVTPTSKPSTVSELLDPTAGIILPHRPSYDALLRPVIDDLASRGVRSDKAAFALRIRHDATVKQDMVLAQQTFQQMLARGIHPNKYHFAALLEGYVQAHDMDSARTVVNNYINSGHRMDLVMYTILLVGYAYQGKPTLAARLFQKMVASGITPDGKAITALTNAYAVVGEVVTAKRVLVELWHYIGPIPEEVHGLKYREALTMFEAEVVSRLPLHKRRPSTKQRRPQHWKIPRKLWRYITPRLQRMRPDAGWDKRTESVDVGNHERDKKRARKGRKQGDVLDSTSQYT
ncbi:hypothetical protein BXZ70DRAFT_928737 [Cristinia sonorae]|uniref:PROP1-like PPR domain-containing protein n=1 Tax=Cristinia sonorae TaxID=1940300 RepID=A0A8K0USS3_9AGAR|nr:hypothetical protein BXZ70DRAFT_928737 [Cristinia sonorae]